MELPTTFLGKQEVKGTVSKERAHLMCDSGGEDEDSIVRQWDKCQRDEMKW